MERLSSHESVTEAQHYKNVLEQAGIGCVLKNVELCGGLGEIPFLECQPQLWLIDGRHRARALAILAAVRADTPGRAWHCTQCGEPNEAQFAACWRCGTVDADLV